MIFFYRFNGDHVEGTSCGSESKNDDVCLQIAFFLCFIYNRLPKPGRAWAVLCIVTKNPVWSIHRFLLRAATFFCLNQNATEKNF